jgi:hypothetical protein
MDLKSHRIPCRDKYITDKRAHAIKGEPKYISLKMLRTKLLIRIVFTQPLPLESPKYVVLWFLSSLQCKSGHNPKTYMEFLFEEG